jgi:hypothetical protein
LKLFHQLSKNVEMPSINNSISLYLSLYFRYISCMYIPVCIYADELFFFFFFKLLFINIYIFYIFEFNVCRYLTACVFKIHDV